jgi:hypothetical protein
MDRLSIRLGYWSALVCSLTFIIYTVCFAGIAMGGASFEWTTLDAYVRYATATDLTLMHVAEAAMLIFGLALIGLLNSIHALAAPDQQVLTRSALTFGTMFVTLLGINYFLQISIVRLDVARGATDGLDPFIQSNPNAAINAINMLGWSLFLGLASLCLAPVFRGGRLAAVVRYAFWANGVICLLGGIGYIFDIVIVVFLTMYLGMGAALLVASLALVGHFRRLARHDRQLVQARA